MSWRHSFKCPIHILALHLAERPKAHGEHNRAAIAQCHGWRVNAILSMTRVMACLINDNHFARWLFRRNILALVSTMADDDILQVVDMAPSMRCLTKISII